MTGKETIPETGRLNEMYAAVLDQMVTPAQVKEELMVSQTAEQKWTTIMEWDAQPEEHSAKRQKVMTDGFMDEEMDVSPIYEAHAAPVGEAKADKRYAKYAKMQKMLPEGAVRQKMTADGFSPAEIDSFFANGPPMAGPAAPAAASMSSARYLKYAKMRKWLPEGAVRQRMAADGCAPAKIDAFFADHSPACDPDPAAAVGFDKRYAKYVKMQKMLPGGAVRQKMTADGFSPAEIDSFFTNGPPMAQPDKRYAKYVKMTSMLPEGAVRQKMTADGFSPAEIDSSFTNGPPIAAVAQPDKRYAKYVKMQKMLPEGAVRQKMTADYFTAAQIDSFFVNGPPMAGPAAPAAASMSSARYVKYVKMQKLLPEGAVRQRMAADGCKPAEIDAFFADHAPARDPDPADKRYAKYVKMQRMLPEGAVRQKMTADRFTANEINAFFRRT